jgi:hypothetical protein
MAASYSIGGLRVDLSMGTADFKKDARSASSALGGFATSAKAVATTVVAAFVGVFAAVKQSTDAIVELEKTAVGLGVTTEAFTRLSYAAQQAGLSTDDMKSALASLNNLSEDAKKTLDALGVAYTDANGDALAADAILRNLTATFGTFRDSASKTATAVQLFGSDALGRQMIPFLNQGTAALDATAKKAEELGKAVDAQTIADAKAFSKAWQELKDQLAGATPYMTEAIKFFTWLIDHGAYFAKGLRESAIEMGILGREVRGLSAEQGRKEMERLSKEIEISNEALQKFTRNRDKAAGFPIIPGVFEANRAAEQERMNALLEREAEVRARLNTLESPRYDEPVGPFNAPAMPAPADSAKEDEAKRLEDAKTRAAQALKEFLTEQPPFEAAFARLQDMWAKGSLSLDQYTSAMERLQQLQREMKFNEAISGTGKLLGAMSKLFDGNKAMAIGQAAIDAYTSFNAALKNPPGPPYTIPAAAAALASGLAQVKAIMSTNPGSPGGGSASSAASAASSSQYGGEAAQGSQGAGAAARQGVYITLEGERYGRDQVVGLMSQISAAVADGAQLVVAQ